MLHVRCWTMWVISLVAKPFWPVKMFWRISERRCRNGRTAWSRFSTAIMPSTTVYIHATSSWSKPIRSGYILWFKPLYIPPCICQKSLKWGFVMEASGWPASISPDLYWFCLKGNGLHKCHTVHMYVWSWNLGTLPKCPCVIQKSWSPGIYVVLKSGLLCICVVLGRGQTACVVLRRRSFCMCGPEKVSPCICVVLWRGHPVYVWSWEGGHSAYVWSWEEGQPAYVWSRVRR